MIDPEDIAPQIKSLIQIRDGLPLEHKMRPIISNTIRGLRNWPKEWDADTPLFQVARRSHIERGIMLGLATVTEHAWTQTGMRANSTGR